MNTRCTGYSWLTLVFVAAIVSAACGGGEAGSQDSSVAQAPPGGNDAVAAGGASACDVLEGIVGDLFGAELEDVTLRDASRSGNDVCRAIWDLPGIDDDERMRRAVDVDLRDNNEVSLTIMGTSFDSSEAAVANLESDVATLTEGITIEVAGRQRTRKVEFGDWVDDVGDRAILNGTSVLVAADGVRFTAAVSTTDDDAENQALAVELARRVVESL